MVNKGVLRQIFAVLASTTTIANVGIIVGWTSPIMEELLGPDSPIPMTVEESSWFASVHNWGLILGSIPGGIMADRWGRKPALLTIGPAGVACWAAVLVVDSYYGMLIVRLALGVLGGISYTVVPLYVGEIAGPKIRGALGTTFQTMLYVGILYVYVAGMYLDYRDLTYAAMVAPALFFVTFAFVPESPHFYVMKNRLADARRALCWLRGDDADSGSVDDELTEMVDCISKEMYGASFSDLFTDRASIKSLIIVQALSVFRVAAGVLVLMAYASVVFAETHVDVPANRLSLVYPMSLLFSALPATFLTDRVGRRPLMIASSLACSAANAVICAYFYADRHTEYDVTEYGWACVVAIGVLCVSFSLGLGSLYATINCELFPSNTRSFANAVNTITLTFTSFLGIKMYPVIAEDGGTFLDFLIFSLCCSFSAAFCWLWLPETRGKTFAAIQQQLRGTGKRFPSTSEVEKKYRGTTTYATDFAEQ